jgi:uncharacterized membrane protein YkvA (DUF1232 family)
MVPGFVAPVVGKVGPRRIAAFHALWRAVAQARRPGSPGVGDRLRALPRMLRSGLSGRYPHLGRGRIALVVLALAYLALPVDLVPELLLPLLGLTDDAVVALWLGGTFLAETGRFLEWERQQPVVIDQPPA